MIRKPTARLIASEWHGGQWTNLYSFASTGTVRDTKGLVSEIRDCMPYANATERKRLQMLADFVLSA